MTTTIICEFSAGLDNLSRRNQRRIVSVLRVLKTAGRYSIFEATATDEIAATMDKIVNADPPLVITRPDGFPWTYVEFTEAGNAMLESNK